MDETLVAYLMQGLDAEEHRAVEQRLAIDPVARERLAILRTTLLPLSLDADGFDPPSDLVLRTLSRVAEVHAQTAATVPMTAPKPRNRTDTSGRRWFRRADVITSAAILLLATLLAIPSIARLWNEYQMRACQQNMAIFWNAYQVHSEFNNRTFPRLEQDGARSFAGVVVPVLNDGGMLSQEASVTCPAVGRRTRDSRGVSELERLYSERGADEFRKVIREIGGNYSYPLGYFEGQRLSGLHRDMDDNQPLLADAPHIVVSSCGSVSESNSINHGKRGQNVLYVGGQVRWCTTRTVGFEGDDIFVNQDRQIRAGVNRRDTVLAPGDARPVPQRTP